MGASDFAKLPHIGESVRRKEDYRFLTGAGQYTDDINLANQKVAVFDVKNNAFLMEMTGIPNGWGGPPTVADFDGDGTPDFGTAGPRNYFVFSLDCLANPKPAKCQGTTPGVLWQSQTKDASSGGTASAG